MAKLRSHVVSRASCADRRAPSSGSASGCSSTHAGPESEELDAARRATGTCSRRCSRRRSPRSTSSTASRRSPAPIVERVREPDPVRAHATRSTTRPSCRRRSRAAAAASRTRCSTPRARRTSGRSPRPPSIDGVQAGVGQGTSKKDAEQDAAREALDAARAARAEDTRRPIARPEPARRAASAPLDSLAAACT